ncbi:FAD-binding protein [Nocardioides sp. KIGAM211]|uniref:FAD-binding protein n=1 Tax=Nocardioides luti TaxID=2761101 RepID=A0A7X0RG14_9ACTN|nr:FAD-binding protein [Nocardioides luti]MBB6627542.1 FAD-binding protein [Nocardioides luti]
MQTVDLLVIGCGAAGLATAVQFLQSHPEGIVAVLERTSERDRGGNTAWSGSFFRLTEDYEPLPDMETRMRELSQGKTDEVIIEHLAQNAEPTVRWLSECGVPIHTALPYILSAKIPRVMPVGGGGAIVEGLSRRVTELGGRIHYETTAQSLRTDESTGAVTGVIAEGSDGQPIEFAASTVVLACGGFEGNPEMLDKYLGERGHELQTLVPGGRSNRGDGIEMATRIGAAIDGQFDRFHGEPVDPRSRQPEALVMIYPYGILVDHRGLRFVDEGAGGADNTFETISYEIWRQADQFAYLIADQKLAKVPDLDRALLTDKAPEVADTIEGLAKRLGIESDALAATVEAYNAAATPGPLDVHNLDGVATQGLTPPKSNWARPIDEPPYVAWPVTCAITFTFGGLKIDERARVLRESGEPIEGLYAAGELAGLWHHVYPGAISVLSALVFGRAAGQQAADRVGASAQA